MDARPDPPLDPLDEACADLRRELQQKLVPAGPLLAALASLNPPVQSPRAWWLMGRKPGSRFLMSSGQAWAGAGALAFGLVVGWIGMGVFGASDQALEAVAQHRGGQPTGGWGSASAGFVVLADADSMARHPQAWLITRHMAQNELAGYGLPFDPSRASDSVAVELLVGLRGELLAIRVDPEAQMK